MHPTWFSVLLFVHQAVFALVNASAGDRSRSFSKCLQECMASNCSELETFFVERQPAHLKLLGWDCSSECKYVCMWKTVGDFEKDGTPVPQFYGKWPFIRLFGIQEPASTVFSVLNCLSHIAMLRYFRAKVKSAAPLYYVWHVYALAAINAWIWSTIFHTRDVYFTELMDYFSAIFYVLTSLFAVCVRLPQMKYRPLVGTCTGVAIFSFFVYHVHYLAFVRFDYSYNMKANVTCGLLNVALWLLLCYRARRKQRYVWKAVLTTVLGCSLLMLELFDFPPIWWSFDAHSLWHAGTIPLPFLWYRFLVDDCNFQLDTMQPAKLGDDLTAVTYKKQE